MTIEGSSFGRRKIEQPLRPSELPGAQSSEADVPPGHIEGMREMQNVDRHSNDAKDIGRFEKAKEGVFKDTLNKLRDKLRGE